MLRYLRRATELPPRVAVRKAAELVTYRCGRYLRKSGERWRPDPLQDRVFERRLGIHAAAERERAARQLFRSTDSVLPIRWAHVGADREVLEALRWTASEILNHRFDLLGSGPVDVGHDTEAAGVEGYRYSMKPGLPAADAQRRRMDSLLPGSAAGYDPIDWHSDFKSGYRWDPQAWFQDLQYGHLPGVDVKVPWDLSRLQHAGSLGLVHRLDPEGPEGRRAAGEFRSQVVDWIAANPTRRGPNWLCTMDVGIRAINWLIGLALFDDSPEMSADFRWLVAKSLYAHGLHIESHLEYSPTNAGNHYLANVVGLLCIGAAMPELPESDRWLLWGMQELVSEMEREVLPDGADFEGSTGYHFLVAEMFYLGTSVALRLGETRRRRLQLMAAAPVRHRTAPPLRAAGDQALDLSRPPIFPPWYLDRLLKMAEYGADLVKPNGLVPLIGDHDSGRLYKLWPALERVGRETWREELRDRRYLAALGGWLFDRGDLRALGEPFSGDAALVLGEVDPVPLVAAVERHRSTAPERPPHRLGAMSGQGGSLVVRPLAGTAIARTGELHLTMSFARVPPGNSGGHYHNDVLSFELNVSGRDFVVDPGTYLYTPAPPLRNAFRSVQAHNTLVAEGVEQRSWPASEGHLFAVLKDADIDPPTYGHDFFSARCSYAGVDHFRSFRWDAQSLHILDEVGGRGRTAVVLNLAPGVAVIGGEREPEGSYEALLVSGDVAVQLRLDGVDEVDVAEGLYSPAYGVRLPTRRIVAHVQATTVSTQLLLSRTRPGGVPEAGGRD